MRRYLTSNWHPWSLVVLAATLLGALVTTAALAQEEVSSSDTGLIQEVTTRQVKRFLDPTRMISKISYDFQMNFLPADIDLMIHRLRPWVALNRSNALWVEVPFLDFSIPDQDGPSGLGDMEVGWGSSCTRS